MAPNMPKQIALAGVIGAGTIGASWTALFLAAGLDVQVYDPASAGEERVRSYVETAWPQLQALGLVTAASDRARVRFRDTPEEAAAGADFIQESVPEVLEVKHDIYRRIEPHLKESALIASSASGLLVREMQEGWRDPARFVLGHPFNPPHLIPLVELIGNERTGDAVLGEARAFYEACGKVTINVRREVPGHVANRLQAALWREAIHLVMEGVASVEDVDKAISAGPGLRWAVMGPHGRFSLASGGEGMRTFCERYGPSFHRWWKSMGTPELTPEVIEKLADGVRREEAGRSFAALTDERDSMIIAALQAFRKAAKSG